MSDSRCLCLESLMLKGFRSWESVVFRFRPGVTVISGRNGAGKTSIRMGVQYAVNGKLPKLTLSGLNKRDSNQQMKATLHCTMNGESVSVSRGKRLSVTCGDKTVSVRDSSFLADLQRSIEYSFLSQNVTAFTDMVESRRRELLEELIPEVAVLRGNATSMIKEIMQKYAQRVITMRRNIITSETMMDELAQSIAEAEKNLLYEKERQNNIMLQLRQSLPFSHDEYEKYRVSLREHIGMRNEHMEYMRKAEAYLNWVDSLVQEVSAATNALKQTEEAIQSTELSIAQYEKQLTHGINTACPHCHTELVCKSCDTPITDDVRKQAVERDLAAKKAELKALALKKGKILEYLSDRDIPEDNVIMETRTAYNKTANTMPDIEAQISFCKKQIDDYERAERNMREAQKAVASVSSMDAMQATVNSLKDRKATIEAALTTKRRTLDIAAKLLSSFEEASGTTYTTLPIMYFNVFLRKLTAACDYLLQSVSDMSIEMSANGDGIFIQVDGKDLNQLSSGELQRVRIAVTLSFALLAVRSDTLFLDEVFDTAMDADGIAMLAELLNKTMRRFYDKIVVITHNETLAALLRPQHIVTIWKDDTGSHMRESTEEDV